MPKFEEFKGDQESWDAYVERFEFYCVAENITDDAIKKAQLLSKIGPKNYNLLRNLVQPRKLSNGEIKYADCVKYMKEYFTPPTEAREEICRYRFNSYKQKPGQSFTEFTAELRRLSENCNYGAQLEKQLRDRIVQGVSDEHLLRTLLEEKNLTLERATAICLAHESAKQGAQEIQQEIKGATGGSSTEKESVKKIFQKKETGKKQDRKPCYRCGNAHNPNFCKYKNATCHTCGVRGHISPMCKNEKREKSSSKKFHGSKRRENVKTLDDDTSEEEECKKHTSLDDETDAPPYMCDVKINGKNVKMEIDTGATCSTMSEPDVRKYLGNIEILPTKKRIVSYDKSQIKVLGELHVDVEHNQQERYFRLLVTESGPTLIGRRWLKHLRLNWEQVKHMHDHEDAVQALIKKYASVFDKEPGTVKNLKAKIHVEPGTRPIFYKAFPVALSMKTDVGKKLDQLEKDKIISKVTHSDWASPIVCLRKSTSGIRVCANYKLTVNKVSPVEQYPIPKVEEIISTVSGGTHFTKLDMKAAYDQFELDEESKKYTTINTHQGLYRYNKLPHGISSGPAICQREIENQLKGIPHTGCRLDDILVSGKTTQEHLANLEEVFKRFQENNIKLSLEKCTFLAEQVVYCGNVITKDGVKPSPERVRAIVEAPVPENKDQLASYIGTLTFYHHHLEDAATVLEPLYRLKRKEVSWRWGEEQQKAFELSKKMIAGDNLLVHYDTDKPLVLACDASPYGISAVLSHKMENGEERPVAFASRTLNKAERNYSQTHREGLSIVFGVKKFRPYLVGQKFTILTDHQPLLGIFGENKQIQLSANPRVIRWTLTLSGYNYNLKYRPGKDHGNADGLSRLPLPEQAKEKDTPPEIVCTMETIENSVTADQIAKWIEKDPQLSTVCRYVQSGWPLKSPTGLESYFRRRTELSVENGCLFLGSRVVIPEPGRKQILLELHETHFGVVRMKALARSYVWWPGIDSDIESEVADCGACLVNSRSPPVATLHPWENPSGPWIRIHADYAQGFGRMFLIVVDAYSKWMEVIPSKLSTSEVTIQNLRLMFSTHGLPAQIVTDNGTCFTSQEFENFCCENGIQHITSAPYHPQTNGLAERAVQTFKNSMKKMKDESLKTKVAKFLLKYRVTPHATTGVAPSTLMFNRKLRTRLDLVRPDVNRKIKKSQENQKKYHDEHAKDREFTEGQAVYVKNYSSNVPGKWMPGEVQKKTGPVSYQVKLPEGGIVRRHQDQVIRGTSSPSPKKSVKLQTPSPVIPPVISCEPVKSTPLPPTVAISSSKPTTVTPEVRRSTRERSKPAYLSDFVSK